MAKYRVELGALVTKFMGRTFTVSAQDEETAIERAKDRFRYACEHARVWTECDTIEVDAIEIVEN